MLRTSGGCNGSPPMKRPSIDGTSHKPARPLRRRGAASAEPMPDVPVYRRVRFPLHSRLPPGSAATPVFQPRRTSTPARAHSWALLAGGVIALGIVAVTTFGIPDLFRHTLDVGCTGSMEPTLSCGDKIVVSLVGTTSPALELGDVIVFPQCPEDRLRYTRWRGPGSNAHAEVMVVHRIIEVGTDRNGDLAYRTRGDANTRAEPCWTKHRNVRFVVDEIVNGE